jgi:hypothetical protein
MKHDDIDANDSAPSLSPTIIYHDSFESLSPVVAKGSDKKTSSSSDKGSATTKGSAGKSGGGKGGEKGVNKQVKRAFQRAGARNESYSIIAIAEEGASNSTATSSSNSSGTNQR